MKKRKKLRRILKKRVRPVFLLAVFMIAAIGISFMAQAELRVGDIADKKESSTVRLTSIGKDLDKIGETSYNPNGEKVNFTEVVEVAQDDFYKVNIKIAGKPKVKADVIIAVDEGTKSDISIKTIKNCIKELCRNLVENNGDNIRIGLVGAGTETGKLGNKLVDSRVLIDHEVSNKEFNSDIDILTRNIEQLSFGKITNTQAAIFGIGELLNKSEVERPEAQRYAICINTKLPLVSDGIRSDLGNYYDKFIKSAQREYNKVIGGIRFIGGIGLDAGEHSWDNKAEEDKEYLNGRYKDAKFYSVAMSVKAEQLTSSSPETKFWSTIQNISPIESDKDRMSFITDYTTAREQGLRSILNRIGGEIDPNITTLIAQNTILTQTISSNFKLPSDIKLQGVSSDKVKVQGNKLIIDLGNINERGKELSFMVEARDPYYSNENVAVIDTGELAFKEPVDGSRKTVNAEVNKVTINPKIGEISITETGIPKAIVSFTRKVNDNLKDRYNFEVHDGKNITMKFHLKGENTDISNVVNDDMGFVVSGDYLVSELLPMDCKKVEMKYSYDDGKLNDMDSNTLITLDKHHKHINIKITNGIINDSYWRTHSDITNTFNYNGATK